MKNTTKKRMKNRMELKNILKQSEDDVKAGRIAPMKDTFNSLRAKLTAMEESEGK